MITLGPFTFPKNKVTNQMVRRAREMRAGGMTFRNIAGELAVDATTVARWFKTEHGSASGAPGPRRQPVARREGRQ